MSVQTEPKNDKNLLFFHFEIKKNDELLLSGIIVAEAQDKALDILIDDNPSSLDWENDFNSEDVRLNEFKPSSGMLSYEMHSYLRSEV